MLNLTKELAAARKAAKKKTAKKAAKKPAAKKKTPKTNDHVAKLQEHLDAGRFLEGMVHLEALAKDKSVRNEDLKGMASKFLGVKVGGGNRKKLIEDMKSQFIVRQRETMKEASAKATSKTWSTDDGSHKKSGGATEAIDAILAQPHTPRHSTEGNVSHDRPCRQGRPEDRRLDAAHGRGHRRRSSNHG
jgi:hypothetical protein